LTSPEHSPTPNTGRRRHRRVRPGDIRATISLFTEENRAANQALVDLVGKIAKAHDATPA
jgi:hypothetical protein